MLKTLNMNSKSSLGSMENLMNNRVYSYDLQKKKCLSTRNVETYKIFYKFMKEKNIDITLPNLVEQLELFARTYTKQKLHYKFSKELDSIKSIVFKQDMFELIQNIGLTIGFTIYYLFKSREYISSFKKILK